MRVSLFIPYWLPITYCLIGLTLWIPLEWMAYRKIHRRPPFWRELWRGVKERPYIPFTTAVLWPLVIWEAYR